MQIHNLIRRLDLVTLQLFIAVYEEGSLTRAAQRESIAVSAASKRLMDLENALGLALFERQARGMVLTQAGDTLLHHARRMLSNVEKIALELGEHWEGIRGYVRMLANLSAIIQFLPEDLSAFIALHERVKVDLEERPSDRVVQGVLDGMADIGICSGDSETRGLLSLLYKRDQLVVVVKANHPLVSEREVAFADTLDNDFVGLHSASSINVRTHDAARKAGRVLRLRIHVPSFDAVCRMVQANMGIGILPRQAFELFGSALDLRAVALSDSWAERELRLVVRDVQSLSPVSRLLFEHLKGEQL
ncbi:LysR family transcriptional regulator [Pseudomonas gingeri]|uniref:LysR family transcriptional regulator n=1 Tax=Pseudomonas gingeri TaxID=117681 RepID=A0A7Y8C5A0_9PSED|nr:LysR family transcriptional regulator [Pseudomonas gingeri]NWB99619.1 LysR family transcriptional regulator [Pseudomonas gingeri]